MTKKNLLLEVEKGIPLIDKMLEIKANINFGFDGFNDERISKKLYELFENFRIENKFQINAYPNVKFEPNEDLRKEYRILARENYERTPKLKEMHEVIIEKLREYLETLQIMDDNNE